MAKWRVANVMGQSGGVNIACNPMRLTGLYIAPLFQPVTNLHAQIAPHAGHLGGMNHAMAQVVVGIERVHLRFVGQTAERCRENYAISVLRVVRAARILWQAGFTRTFSIQQFLPCHPLCHRAPSSCHLRKRPAKAAGLCFLHIYQLMHDGVIRFWIVAATNPITNQQAFGTGADWHGVAIFNVASQQSFGQRVLQRTLHHTLQRTCAENRIITLIGEPFLGIVVQFKADLPTCQPLLKPSKLNVDNAAHIATSQTVKDDGLIQTVEELRPEVGAHGVHYIATGIRSIGPFGQLAERLRA
mmetsp:Transcript_2685/g.4597  ORF Transcript_2685/g.4597 Transcript_2685/m.4597 type:complete len:300 (-) Transcript_2685:398-1297(-)